MYKILTLLLLAGSIQAQEVKVFAAGSGWTHKDGKGKSLPLNQNVTLLDAETLQGSKGSQDLVLNCPRQGLLVYSTQKCLKDPCTARACLEENNDKEGVKVTRAGLGGTTLLAGTTRLLASLLNREPVEAASMGVRAAGGPNDGVVMQTPQGVHWAPALIRVLEGRYCFRLAHLPNGSGGPRDFTLDWDRSVEKEGIATVPNLAPGLYRFEKGAPAANGACRLDSDSTPAWVLVTPQARFAAIDKQWEEGSAKIDDLEQNGVSTNALTALRHGVLATLADSVEGR